MSTDHAHDIDQTVRKYIAVFVGLMVLTVITVAIAYADLPVPVAIALAMAVALTKGSLVACYFMHLIDEKKIIYGFLILTAVFFALVMCLPSFTDGGASVPRGGEAIHVP